MSRVYSTDLVREMRRLAIANHTCPQCLAPAGHPCLSKRPGKVRVSTHGPRFDLAMGRTPRDHTKVRPSRRLPQRLWSG